jgi:hypothetical protein
MPVGNLEKREPAPHFQQRRLVEHNGQIVLEIYVAAAGFELAGDGLDLLFGEHGRVAIYDSGDLFWIEYADGVDRVLLDPPARENEDGLDGNLATQNLGEPAFQPDGAVAS